MSRLNSFFCPPERWHEPFVLDSGESHHLLRVLRTPLGEMVRLFDGHGREGLFRLVAANKKGAMLEPVSMTLRERPSPGLVLALGWTKAGRRDWLLEKAVELEATGLWFWQSCRSQGHVPEHPKETWLPKLVAAAKQCASPWLPELMTLDSLAALKSAGSKFSRLYLLWEEPCAELLVPARDLGGSGDILMVLGPEGGLETAEAQELTQAGFAPRSLGQRVLRWETAALLGLGLAFWARQRLPGADMES